MVIDPIGVEEDVGHQPDTAETEFWSRISITDASERPANRGMRADGGEVLAIDSLSAAE